MRECALCGGVYYETERHQCLRRAPIRWRRLGADVVLATGLIAVVLLVAYSAATNRFDWGRVIAAVVFSGVAAAIRAWWTESA